jgi:hypothetical protein
LYGGMGFETDTFLEICLELPERHKVELGPARLDVILRDGGVLDSHIDNLRKGRYGPGRASYLEKVRTYAVDRGFLDYSVYANIDTNMR